MPKVSVVIPALDEAAQIEAAVASAFAAGAAEVLVADGGSRDATREIAEAAGAIVSSSEAGRGRQLNAGAARAEGDVLLFLHADTRLPDGAVAAVVAAVDRGVVFGGFRLAFAEERLALRVGAFLINLRTRLTRAPWGDQAQFVRRDVFERAGGFRDIPIMEDYELAMRMKRYGRRGVLPLKVVTSGRRFLAVGVARTVALNWWTILRWHLGVSPDELAETYRGVTR
ncbi:MAG: TIGR04283 family arsenosugar biosynthesis glycosyltransferase [Thermoanaerobaculia bacterium]